jgi:putative ATPase
VITLNMLSDHDVGLILKQALNDTHQGLGKMNLFLDADAFSHLVHIADGDARVALNGLEVTASLILSQSNKSGLPEKRNITLKDVEKALQRKGLLYDKSGEEHYNLISALHKSLRGSDPDAALYWLARMLTAGEEPLYIARRMVRFASEDVGNADPDALTVALSAMEAYKFLGRPEGELALAQAAVYLATAPKSNSIYKAFDKVVDSIKQSGTLPVPHHIRNAPTRLMKDLGYGKNYRYAHNYEGGFTPQEYLPDKLRGNIYYTPTDRGYEKDIRKRLERWRRLKKQVVAGKIRKQH